MPDRVAPGVITAEAAAPGGIASREHGRAARPASYRADVDGLRAIAVLAVIGFHSLPGHVRGGYVGVDVFFVISGYLITGVILSGLERDRFTFSGFYSRRVKRIFPALALLLAASYLWAWFNLFADDFRDFGKYVAASAGFVPNLALWRSFWYFDRASELKPLLHLWSLGIEEQFYLVWPLTIVAAWKWGRRVLPVIVAIAVASFVASVYEVRHDSSAAFYSPLLRAWELGLGAIVTCAAARWTALEPKRPWTRDLLSALGLALVLAAVFSIGQTKTMLGLRMSVPTAGAALMIGAGPSAWPNRRLLSQPLLVWIGLVSYPLYLWHWPLLSFATIKLGHAPAGLLLAALLGTAFLLSWITYRFVEYPIRFGQVRLSPVPGLCVALATMLFAGVATYASSGVPGRRLNLSDRAHFVQYYDRLHVAGLGEAYWSACDFLDWKTGATRTTIDVDCTLAGPRGTVLLWGDSYAQALSLGIRKMLPPGVRLAQVATSACPPDDRRTADADDVRCSRSNSRAVAAIRQLAPDLVVLAQASGHETVNWESMAARLHALGARRVVLVGPAPHWTAPLPLIVATQYWGGDYSRVKSGLDPTIFAVDSALKRRFSRSRELEYVSLLDRLCDAGGCLATVPGGGARDLIAVDAGHFSPEGSVFVADRALRATVTTQLQ